MLNFPTSEPMGITKSLLTVNSALLLAGDDHEILRAIALGIPEPVDLYLYRLEFDQGTPTGVIRSAVVSPLESDASPQFNPPMGIDEMSLVPLLDQIEEPVWMLEGSQANDYVNLPYQEPHGVAALKLYRFVSHDLDEWYAFILIVWHGSHPLTEADTYLYTVIAHVASAVLASHQQVALKLLKVHSALLLASNEKEILESLALCTKSSAALYLLYIEQNAAGMPTGATVIENWSNDQHEINTLKQRQFSLTELPLLTTLSYSREPVWMANNATKAQPVLPVCFGKFDSAAAIKLFDTEGTRNWHAVVLFTWVTPLALVNEDRYVLAAISQPTAALITSRRRHLEALQHLDRLREIDQLKDNFMYSISHELRTPLNGIISVTDLLLSGIEGEINPQLEKGLRIVLESGEHLLVLVNEILDFAKIEASHLKLNLEPLRFTETLAEAMPGIPFGSIMVQVKLPDPLPLVLADRIRLRQIFINLLSNAARFTQNEVVEVGARREGRMLIIYVRDDGIGIDPLDQQTIFEPFRQLEDALTRTHGGTGLGLAICKRLVELHQGRIWVTSQPGQGATFYFSLPIFEEDAVAGDGHETPVH